MGFWIASTSVHHVNAWCLTRSEEDIGSPETQLLIVVSCHLGARNQTQVLWRIASALNHSKFSSFFVCL